MDDDNVGPLGVDTDRTFGAMNQLLDFIVGFLVNIHLFQLRCCQHFAGRPKQLMVRHHGFNRSFMVNQLSTLNRKLVLFLQPTPEQQAGCGARVNDAGRLIAKNSNQRLNGRLRKMVSGFSTPSRLRLYREQDSDLHVPGTPDPKSLPDDPCAVRVSTHRI